MKYYIFKDIENGILRYSFLPEENINEESKQYAFKILDSLPIVGSEFDNKIYKLGYNEEEDTFFWEEV